MSRTKKGGSTIFLTILSVSLFLGGVAVNLVSSDIETPLRSLLGNYYRPIITATCVVFALTAGYIAWWQNRNNTAVRKQKTEIVEAPISENELIAPDGNQANVGRDVIIGQGDFVARDKV